MQDVKLELVVLAALLHDVGKLFERAEIFPEARKDPRHLDMCPQEKGYPTHLHATYTRAFCEWMEDRFVCLKQSMDRTWKDWCAAHHRNDETGLEASVVRVADRLSASEREEGEYYQREIHRRALLEPVLEKVFLWKTPKNSPPGTAIPLCP